MVLVLVGGDPKLAELASPTVRLTSVELFAGAGGMALGVAQAGFDPLAVIEVDQRAVATLRANVPSGQERPVIAGDVREMDFRIYRGVDLLVAGPPCQPFSIGGKRVGRHDTRDMLPETIRAIAEARPRAFLIENVRGLTFPAARDYLDYSVAQLRNPAIAIGAMTEEEHWARLKRVAEWRRHYQVDVHVLNAADYGVPQQRVRLFITGVRRDLAPFARPPETHSRRALLAALEGDAYWEGHGVTAAARDAARAFVRSAKSQTASRSAGPLPWATVRDVFSRLGPPSPDGDDVHHRVVDGARLYPKHRGSVLDLPAKTVKSGVHGTPGGEHVVVLDDGSHRYFTMRELAALQSFPDGFELPALRSVAQRQLGNAVPVALAAAVASALAAAIEPDRGTP